MADPSKFFDNFEDSKSRADEVRDERYQLRILKKYFSTMVEIKQLQSIWAKTKVENKLMEVKHVVSNDFFNKIHIINKKVYLSEVYGKFPSTEIWKLFMQLIKEHGEAGLIFNVPLYGDHILHNFDTQPDPVLKKPKIIWPGIAGINLTLEKMDVFVKEYKIGE